MEGSAHEKRYPISLENYLICPFDIYIYMYIKFTLSPAKNGFGTCLGEDHTFFGEVVNLADTLHDICG